MAERHCLNERAVNAIKGRHLINKANIRPVAIMWENFGPSHHDRLRSAARAGRKVTGIELFSRSADYEWEPVACDGYETVTLFGSLQGAGVLSIMWRLVRAVLRSGARDVFFCHYDLPAVFLAALVLRLTGRRVFTMLDSKFDDYPRRWCRTPIKALFLRPYGGAITTGHRSRDYLRYLGMRADRIFSGYDTLDLARIRGQAGDDALPPFAERPFLVVARLIPEKNMARLLSAYAAYRRKFGTAHRLEIIGDGPLRCELEARAVSLGLGDAIIWRGAQLSQEVNQTMRRSLALILPSIQDTFGFVVLEALANGLPVIVSNRAGAVDVLVDNLINAYVVDPYSEVQMVAAMAMMSSDKAVHRAMSQAALTTCEDGDSKHFATAISALVGD